MPRPLLYASGPQSVEADCWEWVATGFEGAEESEIRTCVSEDEEAVEVL